MRGSLDRSKSTFDHFREDFLAARERKERKKEVRKSLRSMRSLVARSPVAASAVLELCRFGEGGDKSHALQNAGAPFSKRRVIPRSPRNRLKTPEPSPRRPYLATESFASILAAWNAFRKTTLCLDLCPRTSWTEPRGQSNLSLRKRSKASFAAASTGAAVILIFSSDPTVPETSFNGARGCSLMAR